MPEKDNNPKIPPTEDNSQPEGTDLTGLTSGYGALDKLTGGFQPSDIIVLAGRGKTSLALALNLALNAALPDRRETDRQLPAAAVAFFSMEMDQKQLLFRLLCLLGHFNINDMRTGQTADEDIVPLTETIDILGKAQIFIDDTPALRALELRTKACRLQSQLHSKGSELGLVVVDYLQLMRGSERRWDNREQEINEIIHDLKSLAKELHLPVLILSQLNRDIEKSSSKDKKPNLSDLLESKTLKLDADLIAFIHWPETEKESEEPEQGRDFWIELLIEKNRNGLTGCVPLYYKASSAAFLPTEALDSEGPQ